MSRTTVELNLRTIFGIVLMVVGLIILLFVAITAFQLATGIVAPLKLNEVSGTYALQNGYDVLFGIFLQLGMFIIIVVIASILLNNGLKIMRGKEQE